jgi:CheY-like chemotaxis protein
MPDGGRLTIRTANAELDAAMAAQSGVKPGSFAMLEVSDTGVGMDAETRAHLFEPFFTTKGQGKGTGLGLSTVYGIVNQSGGHIHVESERGRGATLRIYLPRVDPAPTAEPAATSVPEEDTAFAGASRAGAAERVVSGDLLPRETILLVEDARRVREVVREILAMNGYEVLEARHATEALELSERHRGPIHLMLTDVVMPQLSGHELARRLGPLRPEMRVLYMSGYTDDDIVRHGVLGAGIAFIAKPFTPDALATKVRAVLSAPEGGSRADRAARPFAAASPHEGRSIA